jgi:chaperonin GroES
MSCAFHLYISNGSERFWLKLIVKDISMNIRPLGDRVIVKPASEEEVTKSGIVLPDSAKEEKPEKGEVVAVGPGKILENGSRQDISVSVGDTIVFAKYAPNEIKVDGDELLIIREEDIMAVVEN